VVIFNQPCGDLGACPWETTGGGYCVHAHSRCFTFETRQNSSRSLKMKIYTNSNIGVLSLSLYSKFSVIPKKCLDCWLLFSLQTHHCWRNLTVLIRRLLAGAQTLLDLIPAISGLSNCSFVYNTFSTIVTQRCTPVKSALRHIWIPLLLLSIALLFLTLSWIIANHRNTQQRYLGTIYAQEYSPKGRPL
jgi:hypothetical protein